MSIIRIFIVSIFLIFIASLVFIMSDDVKPGKIVKGKDTTAAAETLVNKKAKYIQEEGIDILIDGKSLGNFGYKLKIDEDMNVYASERFMEDIMGCSINVYKDGNVVIDRAKTELKFEPEEVQLIDDVRFIPVSDVADQLGYKIEYSFKNNEVNFINIDGGHFLPDAYDMREHDRVTPVRDQGDLGTCWAFASLGALETVTMPAEPEVYSVDHMSLNNGYNLDLSDGGEHTMSIAYMASWRGPVYEKDDPYGDNATKKDLKAEKHLEEAIIINIRDDNKVKSAIYKYGGVETSIYMEMDYGSTVSEYYNKDTHSYYYDGTHKPNHDLVIVGWNDNYPKENFSKVPHKDGAYICKNSWGEEFGEDGYIYVSYEDENIADQAIVYTKLADKDNYDNIYQSDELGWVGQMGFSKDSAYFANVYTAEKDEMLKAISFYATGDNTSFKVFVVTDFKDESSLNSGRIEIGNGETRYAGYYTVDLSQNIELSKGQKYAVIVSIKTPGSEKPIAIECDAGSRTQGLDLTDGEGYMSLYGEKWHRAEDEKANICLKAFTDNR
ncbi:Cysteine protease, C1A family [Lachnospiraceae bacterium]|nr:Cysteine protease, C1A family [Lachnospiraceae bacterium]